MVISTFLKVWLAASHYLFPISQLTNPALNQVVIIIICHYHHYHHRYYSFLTFTLQLRKSELTSIT